MNKKIKYSENQYNTVTFGNFKLMSIISADVMAALIAEAGFIPAIAVLVAFFSPLRSSYSTAYSQWVNAIAFRIGQTKLVYNLLAQLSGEKIDDWDVQVRVFFRKGSPEYMAIFPFGREPFQNGGIEKRLDELEALKGRLTNPVLAAVLADVTAFTSLIANARDTQQQFEETVQNKSAHLEKARIETGNGLFYVTGGLMQVFFNEPNNINRFLPLELLVSSSSDEDNQPEPGQTATGLINMGEVKNLFATGFTGSSVVQIKNLGVVPLQFYTSGGANQLPMAGFITVQANDTIVISVDQINSPVGIYFNVYNNSPSVGKFEVSILSI